MKSPTIGSEARRATSEPRTHSGGKCSHLSLSPDLKEPCSGDWGSAGRWGINELPSPASPVELLSCIRSTLRSKFNLQVVDIWVKRKKKSTFKIVHFLFRIKGKTEHLALMGENFSRWRI